MNRVEPVAPEDYKKLKQVFKKDDSTRNYCIFMTLFTFSLRVSDLLSLKVKDILKDDGTIKDKIWFQEQKRNSSKNLYMRPDTKQALQDWLDIRDLEYDDYLFPSPKKDGQPLNRHTINYILKSRGEKAGIDYSIASHSGRKTLAKKIYEQNDKDIRLTQEILGHQSPESTKAYIHIGEDEQKQAVLDADM